MSKKLFVEPRDNGYAVLKPNATRASLVTNTQAQAITAAKKMGADRPDVARVRHTKAGKPDQWRKA